MHNTSFCGSCIACGKSFITESNLEKHVGSNCNGVKIVKKVKKSYNKPGAGRIKYISSLTCSPTEGELARTCPFPECNGKIFPARAKLEVHLAGKHKQVEEEDKVSFMLSLYKS